MGSNKVVQRVLSGRRISIPEAYAKEFGISEGDFVILHLNGKRLEVVPAEVTEKDL